MLTASGMLDQLSTSFRRCTPEHFGVRFRKYYALKEVPLSRVLLGPVDADDKWPPWHFRSEDIGFREVLYAMQYLEHISCFCHKYEFSDDRDRAEATEEREQQFQWQRMVENKTLELVQLKPQT